MDRQNEDTIRIIKSNWLIKDWIDDHYCISIDNNYNELVGYVEHYCRKRTPPPPFTRHGFEHGQAVEKNIQRVVSLYEIDLTPNEKFLLSAASYLHDISLMIDWSGIQYDPFKLYSEHHFRSAEWVMNEYPEMSLNESYASIISIIISYHRKKENIRLCPLSGIVDDVFVNPRLMSAILRLADALHVDSSRVDEGNWLYMLYGANLTYDEKFHWIKSFLVPSIAINPEYKTIDIQINIPNTMYDNDNDHRSLLEKADFLGASIGQLLQEEVDLVNPVLATHSNFIASEVRYFVREIPDLRKKRSDDLRRFIYDYSAVFSPTASKVIDTALSNIIQSTARIIDSTSSTESDYIREIRDLVDSTRGFLTKFLDIRPCHMGLRNMWRIMESIDNAVLKNLGGENNKDDNKASLAIKGIHNIARKILMRRRKTRDAIAKNFCNEIPKSFPDLTKERSRIVLFGNSSLVLNSLSKLKLTAKRKMELLICECRGKTRFASNNRLSYSDAYEYASNLKRAGFDDIKIMPDIALAKVLKSQGEKVSFVLIGANGISTKGECAHTIGHLAVAELAKYHSTPVVLISDAFKIGKLKPDPKATRDDWFTTDVKYIEKMEKHQIKEYCPREDIIELKYISYMVTEFGIFQNKRQQHNQIKKSLRKWFDETMTGIFTIIKKDEYLKNLIGEKEMDSLHKELLKLR
jgi:translation initiation factor 2B subunit (eIF-2B alpha/beta/delta family)